ncbi:hypothetical protein PGH07_03340 [Sulfurovum sp. zt1-1]|uniref:Uncharacterized protein n=1 Tax=Sulfurovum zhangzhouensis TaxID=3019067 RepID=A0ABT7QWT2_9BACT|nr:hypothetical protein [Sulfurovum zhangzhouensis]MDM5271201.1 hypothetical protein [Sulfurovum zhangzhouensis]
MYYKSYIDSNKYILYLEFIGLDIDTVKKEIQNKLKEDKRRESVMEVFSNRVYKLLTPNIYIENFIFEEVNAYLFKNYKDSVVFENDIRIDIKTIIATKNSLIDRPNRLKPSELNDGFYDIEEEDNFIIIARFENETLVEQTGKVGGKISCQGIVPVKRVFNPFFDSVSSLIWENNFYTDNPFQIIGFSKIFNTIEAKYVLWLDSELMDFLELKLQNYSFGLSACTEEGETILLYRNWKDNLLGTDIHDNIAKLEGCELLLRKDYFERLKEIVGELYFVTDVIEI